ncbi:hypothetical protein Tco_1057021 [Tanacetum coccineum]|uniref:Uncharacterized protein n=1 Tax=Tanacetum coccineum TaxID=301880 RepID=A0ABQ5H5H3_9ASTR
MRELLQPLIFRMASFLTPSLSTRQWKTSSSCWTMISYDIAELSHASSCPTNIKLDDSKMIVQGSSIPFFFRLSSSKATSSHNIMMRIMSIIFLDQETIARFLVHDLCILPTVAQDLEKAATISLNISFNMITCTTICFYEEVLVLRDCGKAATVRKKLSSIRIPKEFSLTGFRQHALAISSLLEHSKRKQHEGEESESD